MVTFCLKRSLSIASLAHSFMYESLWNFLSILPLWWRIFFYNMICDLRGHWRSQKVMKNVNIYNTASTFINVWIFLKYFENIHLMMTHLFHTMTCDLRGHWRSHNVIKKVNIYSISSTFINLQIFMKRFEHTDIMMTHLFLNMTCDLKGHQRSHLKGQYH